MKKDVNVVFLTGNLTHDPELRHAGQTPVTTLRLASNDEYTTKAGEVRKNTTFVDIEVWDRQAESCCEFLRKGSTVHVQGALKLETWEDKKSGEKRSKLKIEADRFGGVKFLDKAPSADQGGYGGNSGY